MTSILPELIGKFYSHNTDIIISPQVASEELSSPGPSSLHKNQVGGNLYCYCQSPESGLMVGWQTVPINGFILNALGYLVHPSPNIGSAQTAENFRNFNERE